MWKILDWKTKKRADWSSEPEQRAQEDLRRILKELNYKRKKTLRSMRAWDWAIMIIALLLVSWTSNTIVAITRNWEAARRLAGKEKELEFLRLEVETMELENAYLRTDEYKELSARRLHNKKEPGEEMVWLEEPSEAAKSRDAKVIFAKKKEVSNARQWVKFLLNI